MQRTGVSPREARKAEARLLRTEPDPANAKGLESPLTNARLPKASISDSEASFRTEFAQILDHLEEARKILPIMIFKKEINGRMRLQVLQGETHIQGPRSSKV